MFVNGSSTTIEDSICRLNIKNIPSMLESARQTQHTHNTHTQIKKTVLEKLNKDRKKERKKERKSEYSMTTEKN